MHTTWFITANASRARFFAQTEPAAPWREVEDMVNPASRLRATETETDKFGPTAAGKSGHSIGSPQGAGLAHNASVGAPNKTYQPARTPAEQEAEEFARDISTYLAQAHLQGRYTDLVISASPQFLGSLRSCLDPHVASLVKLELNKDYTQSDAQQLREQLQAQGQTL